VRFPPPTFAGVVLGSLLAVALAAASPQPGDLPVKARQAKEAMAAGRFDEAAALYAEVVQALPNEPGMRMKALELRPDLAPASLFLGAAYMELGQPVKAVEPLQKFVGAQPENREARQMLAQAFLSLERWDKAARQYRPLSEQDPRNPTSWYGLGRSYEGLSRQAFEALQAEAPESSFLLLLVAQGLVAQERDKSAFPLLREAIAKQPALAEAYEALAQIYERSGHPEWARVERDKAKTIPPRDCGTASLECDFRAGRYQKALDAARPLRTAEGRYWTSRAAGELAREAFARLEALPPSAEATLVRVDTLRAQRRYLQSKEELQKASSLWPDDVRIRREQATLAFIAHEYAEARPLLEDLLKHEPDSAELNLLLGEAWLDSKEPAKAIPCLEKAVSTDPSLLRARAVLGRAYVEAGQAERALPHLEAALPTDEDGSLHFQLARAYRETGRTDRAAETLEAFQELRKAHEARLESDKQEFAITPP
jgi:predicted Zn-dependent protease